jgi:hypothetical protein
MVLSQQGILTAPIANLSQVAQRSFSGIFSTSIALPMSIRSVSAKSIVRNVPSHREQRRLNANVTGHRGVPFEYASRL